ncbi:MAG: ribose-phosphate pyrophosphokinase [Clostridia bacterium]|nr:ribose-phosphate pyrophosphokinase [Clostridia bacterium]
MPESIDNLKTQPYAPLGVIALPGTEELAAAIDRYIRAWREKEIVGHEDDVAYADFLKDSYIVDSEIIRFGTGEGKAMLHQTVRGYDLYIIVDPFNWGATYKVRFGGVEKDMPIMPDEHYMNVKRIISAVAGKAKRISVIMPMLYCGRQHKRHGRESLDCAMALQELCLEMGVDNIITFEAHDARVQNSIPQKGFENLSTTYQMIKALYYWDAVRNGDMKFDADHMIICSPDEGGMFRAMNYSTDLELELGTFYKQRDMDKVVGGQNKVLKHKFLGGDVAGKDVIVVDDMISSGGSALTVARELKRLGAKRVFFCIAFGLFCNGLAEFDRAYEEGAFDAVLCTNLIYRFPELKQREWFAEVNCSKYVSLLVNNLNHDVSISGILSHKDKVKRFLVNRGKLPVPETGEFRTKDPATGHFLDPETGDVLDPKLVFGSKLA